MDWHVFRTAAVLFIFLVMVEVNCEFRIQVRDYNAKNGTIKWHSIRRQKREWIKFAAACREGEDNSKRNPIAKIHSDCAANQQVTYHISGIGIDQPPYGVFIVNQKTGEINITSIVDREVTPFFIIYCRALNSMGQDLERPLELRVRVLDINDNPPVFSMSTFVGQIEENSNANTLVMILNATDADEPNNLNSKIAFKIIRQEPSDSPMFIINRYTGEIRTMNNFLDREQYSQYSLAVRGSDRDGGAGGMSAECECNIRILDVNDNIPYFDQSSYSISIDENALYSGLTEIRVIDLDEEYSANWMAVIFFISGNEGNWFEIEMNERTNVGILKVVKPLDYEEMQSLQLSIGVRNKAEFHQSIMSQYKLTATAISVTVSNVIEGSVFRPGSKTFVVNSNMGQNYRLGEFVATDLDTKQVSTTVRYVMGNNPADLLVVDSRTGTLTLKNKVTWTQVEMLNRKYQGTILSIDDNLQRTCTGTIIIDLDGSGWVEDRETNGGNTNGENMNNGSTTGGSDIETNTEAGGGDIGGTTGTLGTGEGTIYQQGTADNVHFGPAGIGLLIMGFLVLGLVPFLLMCCECGGAPGGGAGFEPVPECSEGAIQPWALEGPQPEMTDLATICVPQMPPDNGNIIECIDNSGVYTNEYCGREMQDLGGGDRTTGFELSEGVKTAPDICQDYSGTLRRNSMRECREGGLNMNFMESYFCQKAYAYADEDEGRPSNDCLLIYDIEGVGSPAGSVGCCSFIGEDFDDSFLDTLGPKFKKLADISLGKEVEDYPYPDSTWPPDNTEPICPQQGLEPMYNGHPPMSPHIGTTTVISESYPSGPGVQHPMQIPDPLSYGNVTVTESYTTSGTLKPSVHIHDNRHGSNVVVTERVVGPISGADFHGMLDMPDLRDGSNVIVTERVIAPGSSLPTSLTIPDPRDSSNVVVTERVIRPTSGMMGNLSMHPDLSNAHNVIVTERVVSGSAMTGISGQGGMSGGSGTVSSGLMSTNMGASNSFSGVGMSSGGIGLSGMGGGGGMSSSMGGTATIGHMRSSSDHHFSQTVGSASPSTARSRITKYSTVQYTK
ncbi:desmoglein-1 [Sorex fumeus]|uniref:desmoglein-1 n=1 Tax=Sorex fumeus TaxID=62283 RepID=UPI0024AD00B9|nr:desmoglein-1 [Sorex fumeus]